MQRSLALLFVFFLLFLNIPVSKAAVTVEDLQKQIVQLQQLIQVLQAQVQARKGAALSAATNFTHNLRRGSVDGLTNGEVSKLQSFLAKDKTIYPEGLVTGYFGILTERAVQRWQAKYGIASSGLPSTTGYGAVGPRTRAKIEQVAVAAVIPSSPPPISPSPPTSSSSPSPPSSGVIFYVDKSVGNDTNSGTTLNAPFKTIQRAIDAAQPGDTIKLASGEYREDVVSRRNGTAEAPINITGPKDAVMKGGGGDRIVEINHNYHTLNGFTVDGLYASQTRSSGYRDILIYVLGKQVRRGVEGLKITNMTLKNAGGECLRLRYFVTKAEIAYNTITNCGVYDFTFNAGGKNGEGIYIGTSSKQWKDGKNPTSDPDETKDNIVHNNYIETNGNECVEIKEGATANIIERNICRGQKDPESGGLDSRGDGNTFRYNDVKGSIGAGIRLGGWLVNGIQYGKDNNVYENVIVDSKSGGIKFQVASQGKICSNTMSGNVTGNSVGTFGSEFNPSLSC